MRRLRLLCGGLLTLAPGGFAWWPFGEDDTKSQAPEAVFEPRLAFGGVPGVVVVENHFGGFDPWEDLHRNMQRAVQESAMPLMLAGGGPGGPAQPLEKQLGGILAAFGDHHAGHFGRSGSFQVDDDHQTRFRITAELPGYKFGSDVEGKASESPLSVRAVGRGSLVVSGMQQMGGMLTSWQRSFALPRGCDINNISVTYNAASGNLTVDVPRRNVTEAELEEDGGDLFVFDGEEAFEPMLPPALRAMRSGLPSILEQLPGPEQMMGRRGGFLMPAPDVTNVLEDILGAMGQMHPRFHPPAGGETPVPEDAVVNLVGCFAESQLDKVELKYYGEGNAASFNAMYWHARSDHVPYFAMSRHEQPLGHAFTAHGFVHEGEKPEWGVYDGCGSRCSDEEDRWCGCANEATRGLGNGACSKEGEKRFAVYKIGDAPRAELDSDEDVKDSTQGAKAERPVAASQGRPYWQLSSAENASEAATIEIVVPKGTVAKAHGREVILYNATEPDAAQPSPVDEPVAAGSAGATAGQGVASEAQAAGTPGSPAEAEASAAAAPSEAAAGAAAGVPAAAPTPQAPTATPVGKMRLPVGVSSEACSWDLARTADDGGQVIKCQLDQGTVKSVPIKVIDEL